jgi:CRISPR/Cas system CSM-associated protein Csm2 small subunit
MRVMQTHVLDNKSELSATMKKNVRTAWNKIVYTAQQDRQLHSTESSWISAFIRQRLSRPRLIYAGDVLNVDARHSAFLGGYNLSERGKSAE